LGNDKDSLTTTVSYKLNLRGPSVAVQTFCSTSLVAVHTACRSLRHGECDMALAGGIRIVVPERQGYLYEEGGISPPDGHTRPFDAGANGTLLGQGVGIVVLKRLADALADGDPIHAVIRGTAMNNDGSLKAGYTAPSVAGQAEAVAAAYEDAGVDPETISYLEAHGSATELGDPIEVTALTQAFRTRTDQVGFCRLGSVKGNFGHLDRAAGVTGLIKTVLALEHRQIPPSINFHTPNPQIDFAASPFCVNDALSEWHSDGEPRRAAVNSLGIGGTNVHVVLEQAPEAEPSGESRQWQLLVLSAKTESALEAATANLAACLKTHPDCSLGDAAYTLQVGRRAFGYRRFALCHDPEDAVAVLEGGDPRRSLSAFREEGEPPVAFLFPGLGGQYVTMGRDLYRSEPAFRSAVDRCSEILRPYLDCDVREVLYPEPTADDEAAAGSEAPQVDLRKMLRRGEQQEEDEATARLNRTQLTQPVL
ncbi:MAG: type I polyketide synthase, partial [bacterium]|nr:type I polyketide synthase [bacterium]